jgi:putative transposase
MRIVTHVTQQVQVSAGGGCDLGYQVVSCPKYRRPVLASQIAGRCEELVRSKASGHGCRIVALQIMPCHMRPFVKAHRCSSPFRIASQCKGFTWRRLRVGFPHLRFPLSALWPRPYCAATAGAAPAQTVGGSIGTLDGRPWRKDRAQ